MSLADYLAKNYLNADPKPEKKSKKRKRKTALDGLVIAEDDAMDWRAVTTAKDDEDGPLIANQHSAEFRKTKASNWQTLTGAPAASRPSTDADTADAILASAAAESKARAELDEDAPAIDDGSAIRMENGAKAGLTTAKELAAQIAKARAAERAQLTEGGEEAMGKGQETIYRDASGRIINIGMKRAEARAKAEAEAARKLQEEEDAKGDVQRVQKEKRREELKDAKYKTVARYADDKELNDDLKEQDRWNDPAAQFLTAKKKGKSVTGRPLYQGAAPPNRYGIRPGHKWDGVDRGGGFESEWFKARNRQKSLKDLDYAWQMDE